MNMHSTRAEEDTARMMLVATAHVHLLTAVPAEGIADTAANVNALKSGGAQTSPHLPLHSSR